jgi:hypothetical protein
MGKDLFAQWLLLGMRVIYEVQAEMKGKKIPRMKKEQIVDFCRVLLKFNVDLSKERIRQRGIGCEEMERIKRDESLMVRNLERLQF